MGWGRIACSPMSSVTPIAPFDQEFSNATIVGQMLHAMKG